MLKNQVFFNENRRCRTAARGRKITGRARQLVPAGQARKRPQDNLFPPDLALGGFFYGLFLSFGKA
jgi:hypothetical protein